MPAVWKNTYWWEFTGDGGQSPRPSFRPGGSNVLRLIDVAWASQFQAAVDFLGWSAVGLGAGGKLGMGSGPFLHRDTPHPFSINFTYLSQLATRPFLYASEIQSVDPVAWDGTKTIDDVASYRRARLRVLYATRPYDILTDAEMVSNGYVDSQQNPDESYLKRFVTKKLDLSGEALGLPQGYMFYSAGNKAGRQVNSTVATIVPKANLVIIWHEVPETAIPADVLNTSYANSNWPQPYPVVPTRQPSGAMFRLLGRVNDRPFPPDPVKNNNFGAGTLLLLAVRVIPQISAFGDRVFDIEYHLSFTPQGHNAIFYARTVTDGKPDSNYQYGEISTSQTVSGITTYSFPYPAPDGTHLHDDGDFRQLFQVSGQTS